MLKQLLRKIWYLIFNDYPYTYPGRVFAKMFPGYTSRLNVRFFSGEGPSDLFARIIRAGLNWQYYSKSEGQRRRLNREKFWGSDAGKKWHDSKKEVYSDKKDAFGNARASLVFQIEELLSANSYYHTICEIGAGNGMFLDYLSNKFTNIKRFVGIDLNGEQILENKETYKDTRLEFVHDEITDWINTECSKGTIFVSAGTFEYFTQKELEELLRLIREKVSPAAIAIREAINIDLTKMMISKPRGNIAYSHNYPYILKQSKYDVFRVKIEHVNPDIEFYDRVTMVAVTLPHGSSGL